MINASVTLTDKLTQPVLGRLAARASALADSEQAASGSAPSSLRLHAAIVGTTLTAFLAIGMATASLLAAVVNEAPAAKGDRLISDAVQCEVADLSNATLCHAPQFTTTEQQSPGMSILTRMPIDEE